jgi:hypothetical protein
MPGFFNFNNEKLKAKFPFYISTPSGKPLKIFEAKQLKNELDKAIKKYEELAKKPYKTEEEKKKLIVLNDDKTFLNQKYSEIEGLEEERNRDPLPRVKFPLKIQAPSGNIYELESFEDFNRLENKERLFEEFNTRLGSTFNRKSKEQIAKELEADLLTIRKEKEKTLNQGWYDARPRKLYYPDGTEIPTDSEGVDEFTAKFYLPKEWQRLETEYKLANENEKKFREQAKIAAENNDEKSASEYENAAEEERKKVLTAIYKQKYLEDIGSSGSRYTLTEHNIRKRQKELTDKLEKLYPKPKQETPQVLAHPTTSSNTPPPQATALEVEPSEQAAPYRVDELGNVLDTERNIPVDQEKVRLAKIQEEASRIANLPFSENPYAKVAPQDEYEEMGQRNLARLASQELESEELQKKRSEHKNIFPFIVNAGKKTNGEDVTYKIHNQKEYDDLLKFFQNSSVEATNNNDEEGAALASQQADLLQGTFKSLEIQNRPPQASASQAQNIRSQRGGFEFPEPQHQEIVERYMYPRENEASQNYREAMQRYLNPDFMRSEYKTLKDEFVGELRHKAMRRFNESLKDLNWQHIASKMGRSGFFDQQRQKMFENVQNELNLQDKELGLQLYNQFEQSAANKAREAREGLSLSEQQGLSRAATAMKQDEIDKQRALEAYKVNKLEEENKRQRQKQAALDLIGLGRAKREHAQQGLDVQSAEFMRKQGYPQERLNTYLESVRKASLGQANQNLPEREQIFEPRMVSLPEPPKRDLETKPGVSTAPVQAEPEAPSTAFRDITGVLLGGANLALEHAKYKDQKATNQALIDAAQGVKKG